VVEAKLLLELLMRLLTDPSGCDCGGEQLEARVGRQVRHIVFLLASRPAFADEPDLVARHALHTIIEHAVLMAIGNADTPGREETSQPPFDAPPPKADHARSEPVGKACWSRTQNRQGRIRNARQRR